MALPLIRMKLSSNDHTSSQSRFCGGTEARLLFSSQKTDAAETPRTMLFHEIFADQFR